MPEVGDKITHIRVVNHNPFPIVDRYDGVVFTFEPETAQNIPADAARHFFGYANTATEDDTYKHITKRYGWNVPAMISDGTAKMYFDNIDVKPVVFKLVAVEAEELDEPVYPGEDGTIRPEEGRSTTRGRPRGPKRGWKRKLTPRHVADEQIAHSEQEAPPAPAA